MSVHSANKQQSTRHHCRYCNHKLGRAKQRCPACKRTQERAGEVVVLLLIVLVLSVIAYFQLNRKSPTENDLPPQLSPITFSEPPYEYRKLKNAPEHSFRTIPEAPARQPQRIERSKSSLRAITPTQQRPPKAAPLINYQGTAFKQTQEGFPYYVAEKKWNAQKKRYDFYRRGMQGAEVPMRGDARRYFISENQGNYPEPESGCGPTALLNLYVWYSKFGLIKESIRHSDPKRYKQLKFKEIDAKLLNIQRESRTRHGGTNTLAAIVAIDELVESHSQNSTRIHFEIQNPPLSNADFAELSQNYRVGILSVRPKDERTGELMGNHAVLCIRGDQSGMVTIANWGKFFHGSLVDRDDGQWFVPRDGRGHELRINSLTTLIPFIPKSGS